MISRLLSLGKMARSLELFEHAVCMVQQSLELCFALLSPDIVGHSSQVGKLALGFHKRE